MKEEEEAAVTDFNIPTSFLPSSLTCAAAADSRSPGEISRKWRLLVEDCFIVCGQAFLPLYGVRML